MALPSSYTMAYGKLGEFFAKIRDGQAPSQFTQQLIKDLGFKSNSHRAFIGILKAIEFLTPDGKPTQKYTDYRDHSKSRAVMGEALKSAYSDIFLIKEKPSDADKEAITGKFKSFNNTSDQVAKAMAGTFFALLDLADLNAPAEATDTAAPIEKDVAKEQAPQQMAHVQLNGSEGPTLHYNIQVHLPATKDIEVYNAIFKSIKEHLY